MENLEYIPVYQLCTTYQVELTFFNELVETGLINVNRVQEVQCVHQDELHVVEKVIRIHQELKVNVEGIDVVFNLLNKVDELQKHLVETQNRLRIYEDE